MFDDPTTKVVYFCNEFPSDDGRQLFRRLHRHSKDKRFRFLDIFLEECTAVMKNEIRKLPHTIQGLIPPFETILTLADQAELSSPFKGAVKDALLSVLEIALLIAYHEGQDVPYDLSASSTILAGLSVGLLAAAAVAVSTSLAELALTGAEAVRVAFRLGVHVITVSQLLEPLEINENIESWAYVVAGVCTETLQKEIDSFNEEMSHPEPTKVFISAADKNSVCFTGPPSRLKKLIQHSQLLRYSKLFPLPVYGGLCHASHLYDTADIKFIVNGSEPKFSNSRRVKLPLISTQTGKHFLADSACTLFEQVCLEILTGTINANNITSGILHHISESGKLECHFFLFWMSQIPKGFISAVELELPRVSIIQHEYLDLLIEDLDDRIPSSSKQSKLAIVGMSCRMPGGANDIELFWQLIAEGRDAHAQVPSDRFDLTTHYDPSGETENATETPFGNFIEKPGMFDAAFFNMSPREAEQCDPMHRLALVTAYEALEMAGYVPNRTPSTNIKRIGVYYGQASDDWREVNGGQNIGTHAVPGGERAFANGRINYFFKFGGPSFNIDTACSSGLAAVQAACSALWAGEADTVIAGGLSVITNPDNYCMLGKGHFLSKTGQCKVWDKDADGYCRADGIGSVVIKKLQDAEADNDNIIATVLAGATNHSAEAISITHPHAKAQMDNYNQVMRSAGLDPFLVSFIEMHGTGTQAGDAVEAESVVKVFAPSTSRRTPDQRLHLGAVKSNIGHAEAAAGIASLLKALLVYQKNQIPPHIGIKTEMNPKVMKTLEKCNVGITPDNTPWPRLQGKKRYTVVNSFGAHGGNTTLLLEDAPEMSKVGRDPRWTHAVTVSAKSKVSLRGNVEALMRYLDQNPNTDLGDLSYTTCARRIHHHYRIATSVANIAQLRKFLNLSLGEIGDLRPMPVVPPAVAFSFTGQGTFYKGIGLQLFENFPPYRSQILQLDQIVKQLGFPSVVPAIETTQESSPLVTQLTIVVVEIALARFWTLLGVYPSVVIGHSLGEYAALVVAGIISAADAIYLVGKRAELILASCEIGSHVMLAVHASVEFIERLSPDNNLYEFSCMNSPNDTVISGFRRDIDATRTALESHGLRCTLLDVPFAFHTRQMDPMLENFEQAAKHITLKAPSVPVISPLLSNCIFDGKTISAQYLCRASREPIRFSNALEAAQELGIIDEKTIWIDIGPHPVSSAFIRSHFSNAKTIPSLRRNEENFTSIAGSLATLHCEGLPLNWNEYLQPYEKEHKLLTLENYKWNEKDYWIPYTGTWTLDKANAKKCKNNPLLGSAAQSSLRTSSVHQIISEELRESMAELTAISDMMHPDFLAAVHGHRMNDYGVVTTSIWADMALTVGKYLYERMQPHSKQVCMNVADMEVLHAQVAQQGTNSAQLLQLEAHFDLFEKSMKIHWYNISRDGIRLDNSFASATIRFEDSAAWQTEWDRFTHLVQGRISVLSKMAANGTANKLSKNMAYTMFKNVVEYTDRYRGMQSVVLSEYEAYADINLVPERHGTWHTIPHWIDSLFHLAGLIMNASDASDTKNFFYVTPGWRKFCLARPLKPRTSYRSYVKMLPTKEAHIHTGDIYVFEGDEIVGVMEQIKFKRVPRSLMNQFFSPTNTETGIVGETTFKDTVSITDRRDPASNKISVPQPVVLQKSQYETQTEPVSQCHGTNPASALEMPNSVANKALAPSISQLESMITDCLGFIASETGLELQDLTDDASFVELGVDSLMSLVLADKLRSKLHLEIKSSLFLECLNIGDLKKWLKSYC